MINIGYACLLVGVPNTNLKTCNIKNITDLKLKELITNNLAVLNNMIEYNIKNNLHLFRISSDIIPFGSHKINKLKWWDIFAEELKSIGQKIKDNNIRVSMHPGQYTVLNSLNEEVVKRAILDLKYHCQVLDGLGVDLSNKIILHIGGIYGNKEEAIKRFIRNANKLPEYIKNRLTIENDDKNYNIDDVYYISKKTNLPIVFDIFHHQINHVNQTNSMNNWIVKCSKTWKKKDGKMKIHYSEQNINKQIGSHSDTIDVNKFIDFYNELPIEDMDIMLEVKDKNISALNCINIIKKISKL